MRNSCNFGTTFQTKHLFYNLSHRALIYMVSLIGRFIARNGRNRLNRQTDRETHASTVTWYWRREVLHVSWLVSMLSISPLFQPKHFH